MLGRTLYDITQLLESAHGADERVRRVLELLRGLVPYDRCALLEVPLGDEPRFVVVPETLPGERTTLTGTLLDLFGKLVDAKTRAATPAARPDGEHLAVPLVGLDEVIGLLFVRSSVGTYTDEHVRALSVVAANLASYFTMLRSGVELAELARQRDEALGAARAATRAKDELLAQVSRRRRAPREPGSSPAGAPADGRVLAGVRVLLVDHDLEICESFQAVLGDHGAEVATAASVPEALAAFERSRPDVLLFGDLAMHGDSSYDLLREVTARSCPLPIVSISAWRFDEMERARAAGVRLHLAKPLEISVLVGTVADVAGRTRGRALKKG